MNWGELKVYLSGYVSRTDLTDDLFSIWKASVNAKLVRDGVSIFLDRQVTVSNPTGDVIYPVDQSSPTWQYMESVVSVAITNTAAGIPVPLVAVSWEQFIEAQAIGIANGISEPWCYVMFKNGIKVAPGNQEDFVFDIVFRAADTSMNADTSANYYLTFAQPLFIEAMLIEIYRYFRDTEGAELANQRYETEVTKYRNYYSWQKAGANISTPKGAWSWA